MVSAKMPVLLSDEEVRRIWGLILERIPSDALVEVVDFDYLDQLKKEKVVENISISDAVEYLVKPFADMAASKYMVFTEEIRECIKSKKPIVKTEVPRLNQIDFQIKMLEEQLESLKEARSRRVNRNLNLDGIKGQKFEYTKETAQAELMEMFHFKDTDGFRKALKQHKIGIASAWLEYIINHKERFPQYHATWTTWVSDRKREIQEVIHELEKLA
jgi:hypothetical protein